MAIVFDHDEKNPVLPGDADGMELFLIDDTPLETDWDIAYENPPHDHYNGPDLHGDTDTEE